MPVAHCTFFFATPHFGWVEQFFRQDSSLAQSLQTAVTLARARFSILGSGVNLYRVRCSQVGSPGLSLSWDVSGTTAATPALEAHQGALVRLVAGQGYLYHREYMLRGLPRDSLTQIGGVWRWTPAWTGLASAWLQLLVSQEWRLQCWGRAGPQLPILGLAQSALVDADCAGEPLDRGDVDPGTTLVVATIAGSPVLPPVDPETGIAPTIRVGRVRWRPPPRARERRVNGEWEVVVARPGLVAWEGALPERGVYAGGGYVQVRPRLYVPIRLAKLGGVTAKATGGPRLDAVLPPLPGQSPEPFMPPTQSLITTAQLGSGLLQEVFGLNIPPVPIPPPPPPVRVLTNLADLAEFVWEGYAPVPPDLSNSIGIARIVNLPDTWLVACSGTDLSQSDQALGLTVDLQVAFNRPNTYLATLRVAILGVVPPGGKIIFAGHSLGGMVCQTLCAPGSTFPRDTVRLITFGAPIVHTVDAGVVALRFVLPLDVVVYMSPLASATTAVQWLAGAFIFNNYARTPAPGQIYLDPTPIPADPFSRHVLMLNADALLGYGADGVAAPLASQQQYQLGPIVRIPVNKQP